MTITVITPTRDRPEAFELCVKWMLRQTLKPLQWIIVDDGSLPVFDRVQLSSEFRTDYIRRMPSEDPCTLQDNLAAALPIVEGDAVAFFEDDDWYSSRWLEILDEALGQAELAGEMQAHCYNVHKRGWYENNGSRHAALCRTGIRASLLPKFTEIVKQSKEAGHPFIDLLLWGVRNGPSPASSMLLLPPSGNSIGIKGMPGRGGLGRGHQEPSYPNYDPDLSMLRSWIGADADEYARFGRYSAG